MKQLFQKSQYHFPMQKCTDASLTAYIFLVSKHTCPHSSCAFNSAVMMSRCLHHYCVLQLPVNINHCTELFCHCMCSMFQREQQSQLFSFFFVRRCSPTRAMASSFMRFSRSHTRCATVGRTPLDE
jgi:hypothetical protein